MEYSAKTSLPLNSIGIIHSLSVFRRLSKFGTIFTHILFAKGGEKVKGLIFHSKYPFLAIHAKGEKVLAQSKRTAPPPNFRTAPPPLILLLMIFKLVKLVSYCVQKGEKVILSKLIS
jgi:hypothetical protein